jgi:Protein of unknown function (DUF3089)
VARKFLIIIAVIITLILGAGLIWSQFSERLMQAALVPKSEFVAQKPIAENAYVDPKMWIARPDIAGNPALWLPPGFKDDAPRGDAAIFYIHPTSYIQPLPPTWNASLDDVTTNDRAILFVRGQASAFNNAGEVWAPRYRQANFGAFLTKDAQAQKALDAAYRDVEAAWTLFLATQPADKPIIVAGHSQGSVHLLRLLRDRIAGQPVAKRIVAAYVVGWPVSIETDLPSLGLPACTTAEQSGCILSWQSFAEPADVSQLQAIYDGSTGFNGKSRRTQYKSRRRRQYRRDHPQHRPENRHARIRHHPGALRRKGLSPDRWPAQGDQRLCPPGQQLSCVRLQPVLGECAGRCDAAVGEF